MQINVYTVLPETSLNAKIKSLLRIALSLNMRQTSGTQNSIK